MTREEAIEIYKKRLGTHDSACRSIDTLVELGILKLDKPKTPDEKAIEIIEREITIGSPQLSSFNILQTLKKAGLQIVER